MSKEKKGPVSILQESHARLEQSCKEHQDDYLRALADFDNYRRRMERDMDSSRRMALESLVLDLLPVLDNFDRAVKAAAGESQNESVRKGMELIQRQLRDVLCKHGLEEYSCLGTEFDPRKAEAIGFVHSAEHAPNTVVDEACKGYSCGGKVLRPAKVLVARAKTGNEQSPEPAKDAAGEIPGAADESNE